MTQSIFFQRTILDILAAVSGVSCETLFEKIDFIMTDATSHNLEVEKLLAQQLEVANVPRHLLCHVHPALMFTRELDLVFKEVEEKIGRNKIFASFSVMPDSSDSVTTQFMDCNSRFVSEDYDHKPWNRSSEFAIHIAPEKNYAIRLASERFTRYPFVAATVLHLDPYILDFLRKYDHITNNLACIIRAFESVEFLRIFCLVSALIGIHLIEPYVKFTSSAKTTYADLQKAFPLLHQNLQSVDVNEFFQTENPALSFVPAEIFHAVKYPDAILKSIEDACKVYHSRVS